MVRGVLAVGEEVDERVGGRSGAWHVLSLLGDGDAIFEESEG